MEFQYISDIHLEHGTLINITPSAKYLILAGDIGHPSDPSYRQFMQDMSSKFEKVFLVAGNHEYYSSSQTILQTETLIRNTVTDIPNVHFLQNDYVHLDNTYSVFGATMWTQIDPEDEIDIRQFIMDYRKIPNFTPEFSSMLHKASVNELISVLDEYPTRKWIVITHHMPQKRLIDSKYQKYPFSILNSAYASDIPILDSNENIKAVVYGHTHTPSQNGKYYCNPVGYPGENKTINTNAVLKVI